jgi:uncharacterized protein with HEPN domain
MLPNNRDAGFIWDMLQAIAKIQQFTANLSFEDYLDSVLVQSAVERQLEILGEAAGRISPDFRSTHSDINWRRIIGLRNILIHRYDDIQQQVVWEVVVSSLVPLRTQLEECLPPLPES